MTTINGTVRADVLRGSDRAEWINAGDGNDSVNAGGGNDWVWGGAGNDTLNGGSGSDYLDGGVGNDLLVYTVAENKGAHDIYNGWTGTDTLRLQFTAAEWDREDVRRDVHRFLGYLPEYNEPLGWIDDPFFTFKAFGLSVVGINKLEVFVDGKAVDARDRGLTLADDALAIGEDDASSVLVDLLANDSVADGIRHVALAQPAKGTVELVRTSLNGASPVAEVRYTPKAGAWDHLKEGETATEVFTYTVTDKDGDKKNASVTVTVTGVNDRPVARADDASFTEHGGQLTGSVAANDSDAEGLEGVWYDWNYYDAPRGFRMSADGSWTYDQGAEAYPGELEAGETRVYEFEVYMFDADGARSTSIMTFTVIGVNDAPVATEVSGRFIYADELPEADEDGLITQSISVRILDRDSDTMSAEIVDGPADAFGTLELLYDSYGFDGRFAFDYRVDPALVSALAEGETRTETYTVRFDDGEGGILEEQVTITLVGDGEDPTTYDGSTGQVYEGGAVTSVVFEEFSFEDFDLDEVIRLEVRPVGYAMGSATVVYSETGQSNAERDFGVEFRFSAADLAALADDRFELRYDIVAIDAAGRETVHEHVMRPREDVYVVGGDGDDGYQAYSSEGYFLIGNGGSDRMVGANGNDRLYGDAGPDAPAHEEFQSMNDWYDVVSGFNDELEGGGGADMLHGGEGADRFVLRLGEANGDVILDFDPTAGDRLEFHDYGANAKLTALGGDRWAIATADGSTVDVITLANGAIPTDGSAVFVERPTYWYVGSDLNQSLYGDLEVFNVLIGNGGSDQLSGADLADQLFGDEGPALPDGEVNRAGDWWRWAGEYDDELDGRGGADRLTGGGGADLFTFSAGEADGDVVLDFDGEAGDRISLQYFGWEAVVTQVGNTLRIEDGGEVEVITFENAPANLLNYVLI